ncbi:beta-1,3-galactosyltransferase 5 [Agrilus planipennis]|uniref:Hexosyltransferase n=1 Tax=Agrilus planipennis TaxID=224129 RepID=A0A1W4WZV4_AGRPL|nr:beta-1,3-galactosyltransferase 5 [Agrilus planipennis]XP_018325601.1 beta-1,3-galactosyltransferase 5 [Agrilus planipennis]
MKVPWLAQVRRMHLVIIVLAALSLFLYVCYISTSQLQATVSPVVYSVVAAVADANIQLNLTQPEVSFIKNDTNTVAKRNNTSEVLSPPLSVTNNTVVLDLTKGILTDMIYESGHTNFSAEVCPDLGKNIKLLIIITSAPSHEQARMAIRQTWGHYASRRDVSIAFMLGTTSNKVLNSRLDKEQYIYGDIITGKFIDAYDNLTLKTISMLEWVDNYCPKAAFVLKTDDDMFINVHRLLVFVVNHDPNQRIIYGRLAKNWKPIRNKKSKYYSSLQQYKHTVFPDFTTGPAYLFPAKLARELYSAALNHTYFKLEDVFLTGIVANDLKIKRVHVSEFSNRRVSLTPCSVQRGISIHMVKGFEQFDLWKKLLDGHTKCK